MWEAAGRKSAADQIAFEQRAIKTWVKAGLSAPAMRNARAVGAFGHGAGGLATAAACQLSTAFQACLDMDGETLGSPFILDAPFDQPFLWLRPLSDPVVPPTDALIKVRGMARAEYDAILSKSGAVALWKARRIATMVTLYAPDADHESFTGKRAGTRSFSLATTVIRQFFDEHLKRRPSPLFDGSATGYPEIVFQQFRTGR